ncbi:hypothetical protein Bca4012_066913 [Brassica carinata]
MGVKQALRSIDAFPRAEDHLLQKTQSGAVVSIVGLLIMATLFLHELSYYLNTLTVHQMSVDLKRGETLPIHVNMTFPSLPCDVLSMDAIDMSGKHEVDLDTNIWKLRLNSHGHIIGTEYISDLVEKEHDHSSHKHDGKEEHKNETEALNTLGFDQAAETMIKKVKQALADGEGCRVYGVLDVQRVAGNFHVSVHGLNIYIVPTEYRYLSKDVLTTNQYSVTEYYTPMNEFERTWPGIFFLHLLAVYFLYDLSPITVTIKEERRSFLHLITRLCAVLGGTFALTGMLDRWMFRLIESFTKKPSTRSIHKEYKKLQGIDTFARSKLRTLESIDVVLHHHGSTIVQSLNFNETGLKGSFLRSLQESYQETFY